MRVEVCVPNAEDFRDVVNELDAARNVTVTRAGVMAGSYECVAAFGDSFGNFCDPSLAERLSAQGRCTLRRVKQEIAAQHGGELPVGCAVVVTTPHPKRWLLVYAPITRALGIAADDMDREVIGIAPYLAMRAVLRTVPEGMGVSMMIPGNPVTRSCAQLRHAIVSVEDSSKHACTSLDASMAAEDHRALLGTGHKSVATAIKSASRVKAQAHGELHRAVLMSCDVYKNPNDLTRYRVLKDSCGRVAAIVSSADCERVTVAFSGCRSVDDVLRCVDGSFVALRPGVRINSAVWNKYYELLPQLHSALKDVSEPPLFTGHSLGGALAQLAAHMLPELTGVDGSESISFGAPFVGDAGYAAMLKEARHTRVVIEHDVVPRLTANTEQVHAGRAVLLPDLDPSRAPFPLNIVHNHSSRKYYRLVAMIDQ